MLEQRVGKHGKTYTGHLETKDDFGHGDAEFVTYMNVFSNPVSNSNQTENVEIDERQNEAKYGDIFLQPLQRYQKKLVCLLFG